MVICPKLEGIWGLRFFNDKIFLLVVRTHGLTTPIKSIRADLPAPAMNLYFKEGNATAEAELSTLGMTDGSVTLGQLAPDALTKIGLDHNPATAEGSLLAVPWNTTTTGLCPLQTLGSKR